MVWSPPSPIAGEATASTDAGQILHVSAAADQDVSALLDSATVGSGTDPDTVAIIDGTATALPHHGVVWLWQMFERDGTTPLTWDGYWTGILELRITTAPTNTSDTQIHVGWCLGPGKFSGTEPYLGGSLVWDAAPGPEVWRVSESGANKSGGVAARDRLIIQSPTKGMTDSIADRLLGGISFNSGTATTKDATQWVRASNVAPTATGEPVYVYLSVGADTTGVTGKTVSFKLRAHVSDDLGDIDTWG